MLAELNAFALAPATALQKPSNLAPPSCCTGDMSLVFGNTYCLDIMLTSESLIAKAIVSLIGRLVGSTASISLSKRQHAARYLVKLYYAVQALEETTDRVLNAVRRDSHSSPASAFIRALIQEQDSLEFASNAFIDLSRDLERGLALLNPALHQLCRVIYIGKGDFLTWMSFGLRPDFTTSRPKAVLVIPNDRLLSTDFLAVYAKSCEIVASGQNFYWPSGAFEYIEECEELDLSPGSDEAASRALSFISQHHSTLVAAREQLRLFLKDSFTVDELLFHSDETPK